MAASCSSFARTAPGGVTTPSKTAIVPIRTMAQAKPAPTCSVRGRSVLVQASETVSRQEELRAACSREIARRRRRLRSSGARALSVVRRLLHRAPARELCAA